MSEHPPESWFKRFFGELRRRRVFRVAAAYGAVGFVLTQAADLLFRGLGFPDAAYSFFVVLILLGFPLALALAWAFDITPEGLRRAEPMAHPNKAARSPPIPLVRRSLWFGSGLLFAFIGGWLLVARTGGEPATAALDSGLVAVFPFRVSASDPELGEGMVELLAMKFTGAVGPRAIDPPTAIQAARRAGVAGGTTREEGIELSRALGARYALTGALVGSPASLTLSGVILDTASGEEVAAASFSAAPEALPDLVDRVAASLLGPATGEAEERVQVLAETPLPALMAYLEGQSAARAGRFAEAGRHFERALAHDSTFALASLRRAISIQWLNDPEWWGALELAWRHRDRLGPRDRMLLEAYGGPRFPEPAPLAEWMPEVERVARAMPDRAESWYWFGDRLFHQGDWIGWPGAQDEALEHFQTALALDSTLLEPMLHLVEAGVVRGDTAMVRRYSEMSLQADSVSDQALKTRWLAAKALGDSAELARLRAGIGEWPSSGLRLVLSFSTIPGGPIEDADAIARVLRLRTGARGERVPNLGQVSLHELNRGRPTRAAADFRALTGDIGEQAVASREITATLYWDGAEESGRLGAEELERMLREPPSPSGLSGQERGNVLCTLGQWQAWKESSEQAGATLDELRALIPTLEDHRRLPWEGPGLEHLRTCVRVLEAVLAVRGGSPEAAGMVADLERFFRTGPLEVSEFVREGPMILSRLWEELGETSRALAAIRHRLSPLNIFRSPLVLQEARLAAATGERETAVALYEHYLRVRSDPEPGLEEEVSRVREELAALRER